MMRTKHLLTRFGLDLGISLLLLCAFGGGSMVTWAQGPDGYDVYYVAPSCIGVPTPCYETVQEAVDAADDSADVIKVAAGTYTGVQARAAPPGYDGPGEVVQVVYIDKTVTVRGGYTTTFADPPDPEANPTTLDAEGEGRVLFIAGEISPIIEGLRITGGDAAGLGGDPYWNDSGGGVYIVTAAATMDNNWVFNNSAHSGAGLDLLESDAILSGNTISANSANGYGGGLRLRYGNVTLSGNIIENNVAGIDAGGLNLYWSPATMDENVFRDNVAGDDGGGLSVYASDAVLSGNTISGNTAASRGGGLFVGYSAVTLSGNIIVANTASGWGGGGLILSSSPATLNNNTINANTSDGHGGGVLVHLSDATLSRNSINSNTATAHGGGLILIESTAAVAGNAISHNSAELGGGVFLADDASALDGNTISSNTADRGGGLLLANSPATLNSNTILFNTALSDGGGIYLDASDATLVNTLIVANAASYTGGGIFVWASSPRLLHATIADNGGESGVYVADNGETYSTVAMTNTILAGHGIGLYVEPGNVATLESTLWNGNGTDWDGEGTVNRSNDYFGDPAFVNPDHGNYHIRGRSAAIDAGVDAGVIDDIDGDLRTDGYPDIGADERKGPPRHCHGCGPGHD